MFIGRVKLALYVIIRDYLHMKEESRETEGELEKRENESIRQLLCPPSVLVAR